VDFQGSCEKSLLLLLEVRKRLDHQHANARSLRYFDHRHESQRETAVSVLGAFSVSRSVTEPSDLLQKSRSIKIVYV
jgi:hypothetical protein